MSKVKFVDATPDKLRVCLEMIQSFYSLNNYPFYQIKAERNFTEIITCDHLGKFWLLSAENDTIGYLILTYGYSFEYGGRDAFIDEFYIKKEFRGIGFGTEILRKLDIEVKKFGVNAIHLEVEKSNKIGIGLYQKSGFEGNDRSLLTKIVTQ